MALNHDIFKLQSLLAILRILKPPQTFILNTFFPNQQLFGTADVRYDIDISARNLAGFTHPKSETSYRDKRGFASRRMAVPYIKEGCSYCPADLFERFPGADAFGMDSTALASHITRDMGDIDDSIIRREEWMAVNALLDGKVTIQGVGYNEVVDYQFDASHTTTLTGAQLWSDPAATIYDDIEDQARLILRDSGRQMDKVIMGTDVWKTIHSNPALLAKLDNRRVEIGQLNPSAINGARLVGSLNQGSIGLYVYDAWFIDPADDLEKPVFPVDRVLFGATGARTTRLYGAIQDFGASNRGRLRKARRFPKSWQVEDPSTIHLNVQSAPLPAVQEPQAFSNAYVL